MAAVARLELGASVECEPAPCGIFEIINPDWKTRAHFIALLYRFQLTSSPDPSMEYAGIAPLPGQWWWFDRCPPDLIEVHRIYEKYIDGPSHP